MAGASVPFDRGYDVIRSNGDRRGPNGFLEFNGITVPLWVYEVETSFALSGQTAQSAKTRTFFPHNMVQQQLAIRCQAPSQAIYGETVEFVRKTQRGFSHLTTLGVYGRGYNAGSRLKGSHQPIHADGYFPRIPRVHQRHVYAPEFAFDFVVAETYSPAKWGEKRIDKIRKLQSWEQIVAGIMAHDSNAGFTNDPDRLDPSQNLPGTTGNTPGPNGENRPG